MRAPVAPPLGRRKKNKLRVAISNFLGHVKSAVMSNSYKVFAVPYTHITFLPNENGMASSKCLPKPQWILSVLFENVLYIFKSRANTSLKPLAAILIFLVILLQDFFYLTSKTS